MPFLDNFLHTERLPNLKRIFWGCFETSNTYDLPNNALKKSAVTRPWELQFGHFLAFRKQIRVYKFLRIIQKILHLDALAYIKIVLRKFQRILALSS